MTNFFELFSLTPSFDLDQAQLTKEYYSLSRQYHPDRFSLASEEEKESAMSMSTKVNEGYKVLKQEQSRIRHILELLDSAPQEGSEQMPQDFLMEMMDINELIMDYKMEPSDASLEKISSQVDTFEAELKASFLENIADFDFANPEPSKLAAIKGYYLKSKYLRRLRDNLTNKESEI